MKSRHAIGDFELARPVAFALTHLYFADALKISAIDDGKPNVQRGWRPDLIPRNPRGYRLLLQRTHWRRLAEVIREQRNRSKRGHPAPFSRAERWKACDVVEILINLLRISALSPKEWPPANVWALVILNAMAIDDRPTVLRAYAEFRATLSAEEFDRLREALRGQYREASTKASKRRSNDAAALRARILSTAHDLREKGTEPRNLARRTQQVLSLDGLKLDVSTVRRALKKPPMQPLR